MNGFTIHVTCQVAKADFGTWVMKMDGLKDLYWFLIASLLFKLIFQRADSIFSTADESHFSSAIFAIKWLGGRSRMVASWAWSGYSPEILVLTQWLWCWHTEIVNEFLMRGASQLQQKPLEVKALVIFRERDKREANSCCITWTRTYISALLVYWQLI